MKRILTVMLALALLTGCTGGGPAVRPDGTEEPHPTAPPPGPTSVRQEPFDPAVPADAAESYARFSLELLRASRKEGENLLMSPLSVTLALGMTAMGAEGETAAAFEQVLGMGKETLANYCAGLMADYGDLGGSSETNLVNSLWCDEDLTLNDSFVNTCEENFAAELFHADLQDPATVGQVNGWVKEATRGMIPQVVNEFDPSAVLALVNAIYFKNQFARPFQEPGREWTIDFQNADGTLSQPQGMSNGQRNEMYLFHDNGRGVVLPYDDGKLGLLLMLPNEGVSLTDYLSGWDCKTIPALLENQAEQRVELHVPKFKAKWDGDLRPVLETMGLAAACDPEAADFTAMGRCDDDRPLYIGGVIHKTAFEVNEKGTEAAAVTVVAVYGTAGTMADPEALIILHFDRPFVYGIVDLTTGAPLFLGTMEQMD